MAYDLEMLIFEVRVQSPLTWCQNCSKEFFRQKSTSFNTRIPLMHFVLFLFLVGVVGGERVFEVGSLIITFWGRVVGVGVHSRLEA